MTTSRLKLFFDGGCRPNPGPMETAVVARGAIHYGDDLGSGSNTDAEWLAAIAALRVALELGETTVDLLGDSAVVIGQAQGTAKCRGAALQAHLATYQALVARFTKVRIRQIGRAQNLAGIALEARRR